MSKKIKQYRKKVTNVLAHSGTRGLFNFATEAVRIRCHRTLSNTQMLRGASNWLFSQEISSPQLNLAYLELTNNCNLSCEMCTFKKVQEKIGYMPKSLFHSCVDQLSEMGIKTLYLHGAGESLLHPDFKDFLKYAISKRNHGGIQSVAWVDNGMLFNKGISDLVVDLQVDEINFSIDGVGEVNDKIRIGSKYSIIENNIKYLISKREKAAKPKSHIGNG